MEKEGEKWNEQPSSFSIQDPWEKEALDILRKYVDVMQTVEPDSILLNTEQEEKLSDVFARINELNQR